MWVKYFSLTLSVFTDVCVSKGGNVTPGQVNNIFQSQVCFWYSHKQQTAVSNGLEHDEMFSDCRI